MSAIGIYCLTIQRYQIITVFLLCFLVYSWNIFPLFGVFFSVWNQNFKFRLSFLEFGFQTEKSVWNRNFEFGFQTLSEIGTVWKQNPTVLSEIQTSSVFRHSLYRYLCTNPKISNCLFIFEIFSMCFFSQFMYSNSPVQKSNKN